MPAHPCDGTGGAEPRPGEHEGTAGRDAAAHEGTADPAIRLQRVGKRYRDGTVAVHDLSLDVPQGELVALVGPSGCGKSTTLRMVNRLVEPSSGRVVLHGRDVTSVDPVRLRRGIGYVIQRVGLFGHQTVQANVATVPRLLGWDARRTRDRVHELLQLVGMDPGTYADRYPHELSGGQQQRVGVARALAADPPVLLMDEPFGAVDPLQRDRLQREFRRIQAELHKTVLFVTHDIDEAVQLADLVAVFGEHGVLEQVADPVSLLASPANERVAAFVGADRGIRRMALLRVSADLLVTPPVARAGEPATHATHATGPSGPSGPPGPAGGTTAWAVVLDASGRLVGWLPEGAALPEDGVPPDGAALRAPAPIRLGHSLREGFLALADSPVGWVPVVDGDRYVGVLTPDAVVAALRTPPPSG